MVKKRQIIDKNRQIQEILKCGKDPVYFMNQYVKIQHMTQGLINFKTFKYQDKCIDDFIKHKFNIVLKSRQLGLSTLSANYALWLALFHRDKNILIIATKLEVAMNFIRKMKTTIEYLPKWLILPEITSYNKQTIEFSTGSRITAVPTSDDAGRSEALSLLIVDEAAFVRKFDQLWMGLYPTLSTGGRAIIISTPNGVGDQYHTIYSGAKNNQNEFNPIKIMWYEHPDYDEEWFESQTKNMSKRQIAQELLCDFVASGDTYMSNDDINWVGECVKSPIEKLGSQRNIWIWEYPLSEHKYIVSADIARGDGKDYSAAHVIDVNGGKVVAEYQGKIPPDRFAELLYELGMKYNKALMCPENNSFGYATILKLKELKYPMLYHRKRRGVYIGGYIPSTDADVAGFTTSGRSRNMILTKFEEMIRNKELTIYSSRFYNELKTFVWKGSKPQAMKNKNDDLIISFSIGAWIYDVSSEYSKSSDVVNNALLSGMSFDKGEYSSEKFNLGDVGNNVLSKPSPIWGIGNNNSERIDKIKKSFENEMLR
jgi:hypothetical protein